LNPLAQRRNKTLNKEMRTQAKGILLLALAAFCIFSLLRTGQTGGVGLFVNNILRTLAGDAAIALPIFITILALRLLLPQGRLNIKSRLFGLVTLQFLYMTWEHLQLFIERMPFLSTGNLFVESFIFGLSGEGGGVIGSVFASTIFYLLGITGSKILVGALSLIAVLLVLNLSVKRSMNVLLKILGKLTLFFKTVLIKIFMLFREVLYLIERKIAKTAEIKAARLTAPAESVIERNLVVDEKMDLLPENDPGFRNESATGNLGTFEEQAIKVMPEIKSPPAESSAGTAADAAASGLHRVSALSEYLFPPIELLSMPRANGEQQQVKSSKDRAKLLENTLLSFGVRAKVIHVQSGPTVTRFEVQPEAGVKVSKIISLSDDLALNLAAPLVRIEAPIPGKAALGIEVPNKVISLVNLREVMSDATFIKSVSPLTIGLGMDITGVPVIADLTKMPHLLIAGATGSGKSVCLNTIITSILYKAGPEQVRFLMIDPKVVELSIYNGIPHLLMPVITEPRKAALALRNMVREMNRRYELFARLGVRDIGTYNELAVKDAEMEKISFVVVLIDELADLMLVSPGEVEDSIARLAQMSRAAGIHLLVATQRPSVDVLTGIIKANITSRVAFTVSSQFDSRTILDMAGAEKLLGRGDMLFYPVGAVKPFRVQGAYISEVEVKKVTDYIKEQGRVEYENSSTFLEPHDEAVEEESDALFAEAVDLVVRTGQASISLLQRRFRIGYTRAARLIDDLERKGVVGPFEGSKPRELMVTAEQAAKIIEDHNRQNN
jgi:DNA segregation ATPase FtsK/SpoIIIE, S-DNA-T family